MSNIAIITYLVLSLSIGYAFAYPKFGEVSILRDEKQKYEGYVETVANIENRKNDLLAQFNKVSAEDKKEIETIMPDSFDFVRLTSQIDLVAAKYAISIDNISSREVGSSVGGSISEAAPPKPFQSNILGFSFKASYEKFNQFIDDLEKSLRILDIKSIKVETGEGGVYSYTVEFETYWLKPSNL